MAPRALWEQLGSRLATVLRNGTLVAMALIATGFLAGLIGPPETDGPRPLTEMLEGGGADALIGGGLLALTVIPGVVLATCVATLWRRERRMAIIAAVALTLLALSLAAAIALQGAS